MLPRKNRRIRVIDPIAAHRVIDFKIVTSSHLEIFKAVCRRRVYTASSSLGRHVFAQHNGHGLVTKGGQQHESLQRAAFGSADDLIAGDTKPLCAGLCQRLGNQNASATRLQHHVIKLCRECDAAISGQRPGRCGPYREAEGDTVVTTQPVGGRRSVNKSKGDIDGGGLLIPIFHLGLCQC